MIYPADSTIHLLNNWGLALWHYPPVPAVLDSWGVEPHTDYGVLTLLMQDDVGGDSRLRQRVGSGSMFLPFQVIKVYIVMLLQNYTLKVSKIKAERIMKENYRT